jgi:hypothetical protein
MSGAFHPLKFRESELMAPDHAIEVAGMSLERFVGQLDIESKSLAVIEIAKVLGRLTDPEVQAHIQEKSLRLEDEGDTDARMYFLADLASRSW